MYVFRYTLAVFSVVYASLANAGDAPLFIDAAQSLKELSQSGFDFAHLALNADKSQKVQNNQELYAQNPHYKNIVARLSRDIEQLTREDMRLGPSMGKAHRLFDVGWLRSADAFFELVGVVNRVDREPFAAGKCGELRFIYRLAYRKTRPTPMYSRLPMTFNVVFWAEPNGQCAVVAERWHAFMQKTGRTPADLALSAANLKSIEVNMQSVRWPSTIRPDMGGYAEYILRVFQLRGGEFIETELENTPDVARLKNDPAGKKRLLAWLKQKDHLQQIDAGVAVIPDEFLAKKTISVALQGTHRLANAPFTQIFQERDFADIDYAAASTFKTPHGLLRRLNDLSCAGCHQGRAVAGFHFVGQDHLDTDAVNAILGPTSEHFKTDQARRQKFVKAVAAKQQPEAFRPLSVRAAEDKGEFGAHCGLGDPSFAKWTCADSYECVPIIKDELVSRTGVCEPRIKMAGASCEHGKAIPNPHPHRDHIKLSAEGACADKHYCEATSVGFPGGMCAGTCEAMLPGETCGAIALLQQFNDCLARRKDPFAKCLGDNVRPAAMKRCSDTESCRDDYICARTAKGEGACIPPYFLFQLRVDGHPKP